MTETLQKIVITKEDLLDGKIDELLAQQHSAAPGAIMPLEEGGRFSFLYSSWLYLLAAGLLGAFLAWAVIEPYFEDGVVFTGRVQQVGVGDFSSEFRKVVVSDIDVYVNPTLTSIRGGPDKQLRMVVDDLQVDSVIRIQGTVIEGGLGRPAVAADFVRLEPPGTPALSSLSLSEIVPPVNWPTIVLFPLVAGLVGLIVGAAEGIICRTASRALRCGLIGLASGLVGGLLSTFVAEIFYGATESFVGNPWDNPGSFLLQMIRRGTAWTIAGACMGLGQGLALKSRKLLFNGLMGGLVGGLVGGLLFDPVDFLLTDRALMEGAEASRAVGLSLIGAAVGLMVGLADILTRSAWLRVSAGPLQGKEFSFYKTPIRIGSSPKNEIYLFKDSKIDPVHSEIHKLRDTYEIRDRGSRTGTLVNGRRTQRKRLSSGDRIQIGDYEFVYAVREAEAG